VEWVEKGAPTTIPVSTTAGAPRIRPLCLYPNTLTYLGGDVNVAGSFACR
jgi:feruloyl esterase